MENVCKINCICTEYIQMFLSGHSLHSVSIFAECGECIRDNNRERIQQREDVCRFYANTVPCIPGPGASEGPGVRGGPGSDPRETERQLCVGERLEMPMQQLQATWQK